MGISFGGGSKSTSTPTYWPGQKEAYSNVMNMMNAYMGLPTISPAPAKTSFLDRLFGRTKTTTTPTAPTSGVPGTDYLSRLLAPYSGRLSAGPTDYQPGEVYQAGRQNILDTLSGKYNPITSPYYTAMRNELLRQGEEAVTGARQNANLYGQLSSTGMANVESRARAKTANDINTILGTLFESERARQTGLLPEALRYEEYPRQIAQAALDREYQEFIRQLTALGIPLTTVMKLIGAPVGTTQTSKTSPSFGLNLMDIGETIETIGGWF